MADKKFNINDYKEICLIAGRSKTEGISIRFLKGKKAINGTYADRMGILINPLVLKNLKWKKGDKVIVYHHKDDEMDIALIKSNRGTKICGPNTTHLVYVSLKKRNVKVLPRARFEVSYQIHNNEYLTFVAR